MVLLLFEAFNSNPTQSTLIIQLYHPSWCCNIDAQSTNAEIQFYIEIFLCSVIPFIWKYEIRFLVIAISGTCTSIHYSGNCIVVVAPMTPQVWRIQFLGLYYHRTLRIMRIMQTIPMDFQDY